MRGLQRGFGLLWALLAPLTVLAAGPPILWQSGPEFLVAGEKDAATGLVVIQFVAHPTPAERRELSAQGLHLLSYVGANAWLARIQEQKSPGVIASVLAIAPVKLDWKLHPNILKSDMPPYAVVNTGAKSAAVRYVVSVQFFPDIDGTSARLIAEGHGMTVVSEAHSIRTLTGTIEPKQLQALAADTAVQWIEPATPALEANNDGVRQASQVQPLQSSFYGLDGEGVAVLVYDSGMADAAHPDFGGRLAARESDQEAESHPTHVAGTIGASGGQSLQFGGVPRQWQGMAPAVRLESFEYDRIGIGEILFADLGDFEQDYEVAINELGVDLANNSLGSNVAANGYPCELHGNYGLMSHLIDATVRGALGRPSPIVFSGGNERGSGRCGLNFGTLSPPAAAKNSLVVGAIASDTREVAGFSGWGPADDGRIKPDIVAPGAQSSVDFGVTSTQSGGGYTIKSGTSMAAPAVTGAIALWMQQWRRQFGQSTRPLPALIKAVFLQTAEDLGEIGPDYQYGFGALRAQNAVNLLLHGTWIQGEVGDASAALHLVQVNRGASELKATLAWDDVPGSPNVNPALVNDLDLVAVSPSGVVHYPWTLDPTDPAAPAVRNQPDRVNNVEQVYVSAPEEGLWQLRVVGHSIPDGPQAYGLASWPDLRQCGASPVVLFTGSTVSCEGGNDLVLADCAANLSDAAVDSVLVHVTSTADAIGTMVTLTENSPDSGVFQGSVDGIAVADSGVLRAAYMGPEGTATASVPVDCTSPAVTDVDVDPSTVRATITITTSELARVTAYYGPDCESAPLAKTGTRFDTHHELVVDGLAPETPYRFFLEVVDPAGNVTRADNGGPCFSFTTGFRPDYFTEFFLEGEFDLANSAVRFTPADNGSGYRAEYIRNVYLLSDVAQAGEILELGDDASTPIRLEDGRTVSLYGVEYDRFRVGSNGYINPVRSDTIQTPSLTAHFGDPRISVMFHDLDPSRQTGGGEVRYANFDDHIAVSWINVPQWDKPNVRNTAQLRWFDSGVIELVWAEVHSEVFIAGLSPGRDAPFDFAESDFSAYPIDALTFLVPSVIHGRENAVLEAVFGADSPHGTPTISVEGLPAAARFSDRADGTALVSWLFRFGDAGRYGPYSVTASDGLGSVTRSFVVEVAETVNQPPIAQDVRIAPSMPDQDETLRALWHYFDPESFPEATPQISWYRDGAIVPGLNGRREVSASLTTPGQKWAFVVEPNDGLTLGSPVQSNTVVIRHRFDISGDGVLDSTDLQRVINAVLGNDSTAEGDVNGDGVTNALDVQAVIVALLAA